MNKQDLMKTVFFLNYEWNNIWCVLQQLGEYFFNVKTHNLYWSYYTSIQKYVKGFLGWILIIDEAADEKIEDLITKLLPLSTYFQHWPFLSIFWKKKKLCGWVWFFQVIWLPLYKRVKYIWQILQIQQKRGFNRFEIRTEGFKK